MGQLFSPITSLPEHRGLDCSMGCDFVPGYTRRMLHCGITHSVDRQPACTTFARLWVYDDSEQVNALVEVHPETGKSIPMGEAAREAVETGVPVMIPDPATQSLWGGGTLGQGQAH